MLPHHQNELDQLRYGPGPAKSQDRVDFQDIVAEVLFFLLFKILS